MLQPNSDPPPIWLRAGAIFALLLWAATVHWFSSRTGEEIVEMNVFELSDKIAHFIAFACGAPPLVCALRWSTRLRWPRIALLATLTLAAYGAADEYHQKFTPNRSGADVYDWTADALGGLAGTLLTISIYARLQRSYRPAPAGN
jgi:VanZ family protein